MRSEGGPFLATLTGLGAWYPDEIRDNDAWPAEFRAASRASADRELIDVDATKMDACDRLVMQHLLREAADPFLGTTRRRVAPADISAAEAEHRAARAALREAGVTPDDVDVIVSWAAAPDRLTPSSGLKVADLLGARRAYALGMDAGCATPLTQLIYAAALIESGRARHVLLVHSHIILRAFPMMHPASPNVGDGATAMVLSRGSHASLLASRVVSHGEYYDAVTWRRRDGDAPWWCDGPGFYLGSNDKDAAQYLVRNTVRLGAQTVRELMDEAAVPVGRLAALASVQPRRWIPGAIAEVVGLDPARAPQTFDEYAHLGGAGMVANLIEARRRGLLQPGALVALYAQGAGFTRAAALLSWRAP